MLAVARAKGVYADLTQTVPGAPIVFPEGITAVICCGSISIGAGPADLLAKLGEAMAPEAVLVLTYNDDTLRNAGYMGALTDVQLSGLLRLEVAEYGPQMPALGRNATAYALRRL
jgi:hypothetical protein